MRATTASGQTFYRDDELRGFGLRVTASGSRSYIAQGRVGVRTRRVTIGTHGRWTCDEARLE
ncbi:MAG: Arm DNA-binding domain-containing protein [Pseudomonadota bacterium]